MTSSTPSKWWQFTCERFDPISHFLMIGLFFFAHYVTSAAEMGRQPASLLQVLILLAGTTAFFFKLRLYDEIKDYEVDLIINPTRPLARGLVSHSDLYKGISICILIELISFGSFGSNGLIMIALAIGYSLLMYKEFFMGERLRRYLTTYALTHTVVSAILSLAILTCLSQSGQLALSTRSQLFALNSWCLFNIFEFGRKTFASTEERSNVESYSKIFGRWGAVLLVVLMALVSALCLTYARVSTDVGVPSGLVTWVSVLVLVGAGYAVLDRSTPARAYRALASLYIIIIYSSWIWVHSAWFVGLI